jgi:hypothetical protein
MVNAGSTATIGAFGLLDGMGRELRNGRLPGSTGSVPLNGLAPGAYFLRTAVGAARFVFAPGQ